MQKYFIADNNEKITYIIKKSKRKTISIAVLQDGQVIVHVPNQLSNSATEEILIKKQAWIIKKRQDIIKANAAIDQLNLNYEDGSNLLYEGCLYPLHIVEKETQKRATVKFNGESFYIYLNNAQISNVKDIMRIWYREQAKVKFLERVDYFQQYVSMPYGMIRIKEQKGCYGSCSAKGNLNFNWKCILAPKEILDYVVLHELCHLKFFNHSSQFWGLVKEYMPDYQLRRAWLKEKGRFLNY